MNGEVEKKTILAVDDRSMVTRMMERVLKFGCNANVLTANTKEDALKIIASERGKINLLVSDWDIEPEDGAWEEVIRVGIEADIPVVVVSGRIGESGVNEKITEAGATKMLLKGTENFVETIRSALEEKED